MRLVSWAPPIALLIVAACGQASSDSARTSTTRQELVAYDDTVNPKYLGDDLGDHEIALTFDDGPGPIEVTGALAQWLHDHKDPKTGAPAPIQATFFVIGDCIADTTLGNDNPTCDRGPNPKAVLDKVTSLGHYIGNHTTTHRALTDIPNEAVEELTETDALISKYLIWNRMFFRAPTGAWNGTVFNKIKGTAMNKYAGPIYWNVGGGAGDPPVQPAIGMAADWACWEGPNGDGSGKKYSTKQCGDLYIQELRANGNKGIILMHDAKGDTANHSLTTVPGNTFDMLKYVIGEIEKDATPWKFKRLDEIPEIAAVLPKCDASCVQCSGPAADKCTACAPDKHLDGGKCVAGAPPADAGADPDGGGSSSGSTTSSSSSTSGDPGKSSTSSGNNASGDVDAGATAGDAGDDGGCNESGGSGSGATALLLGVAAILSLRSKKRRG